jgi:hypothetical protein
MSVGTCGEIIGRRRGGRRTFPVVGAVFFLFVALSGFGSRSLATPSVPTLGSGRAGTLLSVSADSVSDAWAVGYIGSSMMMFPPDQALALHWNGTAWTKVATPNPGGTQGINALASVSALSENDAWAVGSSWDSTTSIWDTLVLHWNGTAWTKVASPNPGGSATQGRGSFLSGVSAVSANDVWAVGRYNNPDTGANQTLILNRNGTHWTKVAHPNPGGVNGDDGLTSVSSDSPTDAWAVGWYANAADTLMLHWNGTRWKHVASPNPGGTTSSSDESLFNGVSVASATDALAVGTYTDPTSGATDTLIAQWNGTAWSQGASPNPDGTTSASDGNQLYAVDVVSPTDAWAVGYYLNGTSGSTYTLVAHWNGTTWSTV